MTVNNLIAQVYLPDNEARIARLKEIEAPNMIISKAEAKHEQLLNGLKGGTVRVAGYIKYKDIMVAAVKNYTSQIIKCHYYRETHETELYTILLEDGRTVYFEKYGGKIGLTMHEIDYTL